MAFPYKHVLLIGATSGIGRAMLNRLVKEGVKVIAVGRRQDRLDELVSAHGAEKISTIRYDLADAENAPNFISDITTRHPDLDCVFLNAGAYQLYDFSKPETVDIEAFHSEMRINFTAYVNVVYRILPFLLKNKASGIIFTGSHLSVVPLFTAPGYGASKAALNSFAMCLREQLRKTDVRVTEISPPVVQSELHDKTMGPERGRKAGMPVDEFVDLAYKGLVAGEPYIVIGTVGMGKNPAGDAFPEVVAKRQFVFEELTKAMRKH